MTVHPQRTRGIFTRKPDIDVDSNVENQIKSKNDIGHRRQATNMQNMYGASKAHATPTDLFLLIRWWGYSGRPVFLVFQCLTWFDLFIVFEILAFRYLSIYIPSLPPVVSLFGVSRRCHLFGGQRCQVLGGEPGPASEHEGHSRHPQVRSVPGRVAPLRSRRLWQRPTATPQPPHACSVRLRSRTAATGRTGARLHPRAHGHRRNTAG